MINETTVIQFARYEMPGGIHPAEFKSISSQQLIKHLAPASELLLALPHNIDFNKQLLVSDGEEINSGQALLAATDQYFTATHSPCHGKIIEIGPQYLGHPSGLTTPSIRIQRLIDKKSDDSTDFEPMVEWQQLSAEQLIQRIHRAGIVGMGGAAFPTHLKLGQRGTRTIDTLIVNGMECEPYITCDDRMLREKSKSVLQGALIASKIVGAKTILFGIEDNKPEAIEALSIEIEKYNQLSDSPGPETTVSPKTAVNYETTVNPENTISPETTIKIIVAKTNYPSGGEKQLIQLLTGQEVPRNQYPIALGILVQNIATLYAINDAICNGQSLTHRVVTLTGDLVKQPGNYWIAFGTPLSHIVTTLEIDQEKVDSVTFGGPLMGQVFKPNDSKKTDKEKTVTASFKWSIPTQKSTNCLIFNAKPFNANPEPSNEPDIRFEYDNKDDSHIACIRCGECESVCPASLVPQQLYWFAQSEQWEPLKEQNLFDCIECGACQYVCPSKIPLVDYYRFAKTEIKLQQQKHTKSELAKLRFENREKRLTRIKKDRQEKREQRQQARKLAATNSQDPDGKISAIQAALQRVKKKKEQKS